VWSRTSDAIRSRLCRGGVGLGEKRTLSRTID
jgi:hypothetical protein